MLFLSPAAGGGDAEFPNPGAVPAVMTGACHRKTCVRTACALQPDGSTLAVAYPAYAKR